MEVPVLEIRDVPIPRGRVVLEERLYFEFRHWLDVPIVPFPSATLQYGDAYLPVFLRTGRLGPPVVFITSSRWHVDRLTIGRIQRGGVYVRNFHDLGLRADACFTVDVDGFTCHFVDPEQAVLYTGLRPDPRDSWVEIAEDVALVLRGSTLRGILLRSRDIRELVDC